jgi:putative Holliday junction resolvase
VLYRDARDFYACLPLVGRLLAIDYGRRRVGLALSDPGRCVATPWEVLGRTTGALLLNDIFVRVDKEAVCGLVIGYPLTLEGKKLPTTQGVEQFTRTIHRARPALPILWAEERFTTSTAERMLLEADLRRDARALVRDKVAAAVVLQQVLDGGASYKN